MDETRLIFPFSLKEREIEMKKVEQLKAVSTYDGAEIFEEISEKGA